MKVSIALCTFNGERFLAEQLDSIAGQTRLPDQLVISDDGSSDNTLRLVKDFVRNSDIQVDLITGEKTLGVVGNFERAISRCSGDVIFLCDQDDVWQRVKIERILREFESENVVMAFCDADVVDEELNTIEERRSVTKFENKIRFKSRIELFGHLLDQNMVIGMTMAFRPKLKEIAVPFPTDLPDIIHDGWLSLAAPLCGECVFVDESLVLYRQHAQQRVGAAPGAEPRPAEDRYKRMAEYTNAADYQIDRLSRIKSRLEQQVFPKIEPAAAKAGAQAVEAELGFWQDKNEHLRWRAGLSENRLKRIPQVVARLADGSYSKFSNGLRSAVDDVCSR